MNESDFDTSESWTPPRDASCPRCGYDQRGVVTSWNDLCPLEGVCTECGLTFLWADVLNARLRYPNWCVEGGGISALPGRMWNTLLRTFWPWLFWRELQMHQGIQPGRIILYWVALLASTYVVFAIAHGVAAWMWWDRIGWMHSTDGFAVFFQATMTPFSDRSIGFHSARGMAPMPYLTPIEVFRMHWPPLALVSGAVAAAHCCCALAFATLPISRRRAKVRWPHIVRVAAYGGVLFLLPVWLTMVTVATAGTGPLMIIIAVTLATWFALLPLEVIWWSVATSRYLRIPHAWGVGVAVVLLGALIPLAGYSIWYVAFG